MSLTSIILLSFCLSTCVSAQAFFSKIFDFGGDNMEGKIYNIIPLQEEIKVLGLLHDSIVPGFDGGTWPYLSTISYGGNTLETSLLTDKMFSNGFTYFKRRIAFKNDSICYLYDRRDLGGMFFDASLNEINYKTGQIVRSKIIYDQISDHQTFGASDIFVGIDGTIYLINVTDEFGPHPQILTILDTSLSIINQVFIPNFGRSNITKFTELDSAGNLILVGVSYGQSTPIWFESKLFRQVLDKNLNSIDFKLAETKFDQSIIEPSYYPIIKSKSGNWIIASQVVTPTNDCSGCAIFVPYIVSISSDFNNVNWETRLFDGDIRVSQPSHYVQAITEVSDGYIFAGSTDGDFGIETSGLLGKVSLQGDSLWLKHIVPIEWDTVQGRWFLWQDIQTTPAGNIVIGGFGSNSYASIIQPWILHLDSEGCLIPGCNILISSNEIVKGTHILVYPNPASSHLNISASINFQEECYILIFDQSGKLILKSKALFKKGSQYLLNIPDSVFGNYILNIVGKSGNIYLTHNILIE